MPRPASRSATSRRWTNSIAPTSNPRVGCAATSTRGLFAISRAITTFCWLPPDNAAASVSGSPPRMSNSRMSERAAATIRRGDRMPWREYFAVRYSRRARFSAIEKFRTRPRRWRSSAMWEMPAATRSRAPAPVRSRPSTSIVPRSVGRRPVIASTSSLWPLPSTPASATISPARTVRSTPWAAGRPRSSRTCRSRSSRIGSPAVAGTLSTRSRTSRPTMSRASDSSLAPSVATVSTRLPRRSTVTRSAISSTSPSLCEMNTIALPSSRSARRTQNSSCVSCAVSTAVGSSRTRMLASRYSALRISTRCCCPTETSSTTASGATASPHRSDSARTRAAAPATSSSAPDRGSSARTMFSATVMTGISMKCWWTMPIPRSIAARGESIVTGSPRTTTRPSSGPQSPYRIDISVDLPAPFSPSRAWTSPTRRSKSTPSLATIRPKRFVIPRSSSAASTPCRRPPGLRRAADGVRRGDLAGRELLLDRVDLGLVLRAGLADLADPDAVVRDGAERVRPALVLVLLDRQDLLEHGHVALLQRAREHLRAEVGLIGVDADRLHALLLGRVDGAEPALAGDLEDDLGALGDLVQRDLLALRLVDEVLRVAVQELHARVGLLRSGLEARDVVVDRRDLLTADRAERAAVVLGVQARQIADEVAGLLLLEEQALDVLGLALQQRRRGVDDRELHVRELLRDRGDRVGHEEADPDHEVVLLLGERREVGDVVGVGLRDQGAALDPELLLGVLEALVGQEVERAVVEAADVGHEAALEFRAPRRGRRRAAARAAAAAVVAAPARRHPEGADGQAEGDGDRP